MNVFGLDSNITPLANNENENEKGKHDNDLCTFPILISKQLESAPTATKCNS